jgi:hypothetical protein
MVTETRCASGSQAPISYTSLSVHYLSKFPHLQQIHYILLQSRKLHFLRPLSDGTSFTSDNAQPAQSFVPTISCDKFATTILRSLPAMDPRHIRCKDLKRNILDAFERLRNSETSINPTGQLRSGWIASNLNYPTSSLQAAVRFERYNKRS